MYRPKRLDHFENMSVSFFFSLSCCFSPAVGTLPFGITARVRTNKDKDPRDVYNSSGFGGLQYGVGNIVLFRKPFQLLLGPLVDHFVQFANCGLLVLVVGFPRRTEPPLDGCPLLHS